MLQLRNRIGLFLALSSLLLLGACTGNGSAQGSVQQSQHAVAAPVALQTSPLPAPLQLLARPARHAAGATPLAFNGVDYDQAMSSHRVFVSGQDLTFAPSPSDGNDGLKGLAYAGFSFSLGALTPEPQLRLIWNGAAPASANTWVALGNLTSNRWDWFALDATQQLNFGSLQSYEAVGTGRLLLIVAATGSDITALRRVRLGAPVAQGSISVSPDTGLSPLLTNVDASNFGLPGDIGSLDCDWNADGTFDDLNLPAAAAAQHSYSAGQHDLSVHFHDDEGYSADANFSVRAFANLWDAHAIEGGPNETCLEPRLAIVADKLCMVYASSTMAGVSVNFVLANDPLVHDWGTPVPVQMDSDVLNLGNLTEVDGTPAFCMSSALSHTSYFRATDVAGSAWSSEITAIPTLYPDSYPKMLVAAGRPAIAVRSGSNLVYKRADDADGTSWGGTLYTIQDQVLDEFALTLLDGKPAVALFHDPGKNYLMLRSDSDTGEQNNWTFDQGFFHSDTDGPSALGLHHGCPVLLGYTVGSSMDSFVTVLRATTPAMSAWDSGSLPDTANVLRGTYLQFAELTAFQDYAGLAVDLDTTDQRPEASFFDFPPGGNMTWNSGFIDTANSGQELGLVVWHGVPIVCYEDESAKTVKVAVLQ